MRGRDEPSKLACHLGRVDHDPVRSPGLPRSAWCKPLNRRCATRSGLVHPLPLASRESICGGLSRPCIRSISTWLYIVHDESRSIRCRFPAPTSWKPTWDIADEPTVLPPFAPEPAPLTRHPGAILAPSNSQLPARSAQPRVLRTRCSTRNKMGLVATRAARAAPRHAVCSALRLSTVGSSCQGSALGSPRCSALSLLAPDRDQEGE